MHPTLYARGRLVQWLLHPRRQRDHPKRLVRTSMIYSFPCQLRDVSRDIMHDRDAYDNPDEFRPERFIRDGQLDSSVRDPNAFIFGFGRRRVGSFPFSQAEIAKILMHRLTLPDCVPGGTSPTRRCSSISRPCCTSSTSALRSTTRVSRSSSSISKVMGCSRAYYVDGVVTGNF